MNITVSDDVKSTLAKYGPNKLFGDDVDDRKKLPHLDAVRLFNRVWNTVLAVAIETAEKCDSDDAKQRLTFSQQQYFKSSQEHRSFRMQNLNAEFIVQLARGEGDHTYELTQLWRVSSSDTHPKTLFVTFDTVEQRERFKTLAQNLGIKDEDLGLQLVLDFMAKHPGRFFVDGL